jgi:hypothetical protein
MSFNLKDFFYDKEIDLEYQDYKVTLKIMSNRREVPVATVSSNRSKYCTIMVPYTVFSSIIEDGLSEVSHYTEELQEGLILRKKSGCEWEMVQYWEEEKVITLLAHKDVITLSEHCSRYIKVSKHVSNKLKPTPRKRAFKLFNSIFNYPRKLISW